MPKGKGEDYSLYVSTSEPATATDISNYNLIGFAMDHNLNLSQDLIEAADKDTGGDMEYVPGRREQTVEGTFHLEKTHGSTDGDQGQEVLFDNVQNTTSGDELYFLLTDNVTGHRQYHGRGIVEELDITFPDQDMIEVSLTFQIAGGITRTSV